MALCYSTDPIIQKGIDKKKPKYRPTDDQKLKWSLNDTMRFGSSYQSKVEMQKTNGRFNQNHHEE